MRVRIAGEPGAVSASVHVPSDWTGAGQALVLGHGAGGDMETAFLLAMADGLAMAGVLTMRFNFPYAELGRGGPDPQQRLVNTYAAAVAALRESPRYAMNKLFVGGKSMGGRIAAIGVAAGRIKADGMVFLGYPLHPAGKPADLRDQPVLTAKVPMLFVQGTRDQLCDLTLLESVRARIPSPNALMVIEGGDHSFALPRSGSEDPKQVGERIIVTVKQFLEHPVGTPVSPAALAAARAEAKPGTALVKRPTEALVKQPTQALVKKPTQALVKQPAAALVKKPATARAKKPATAAKKRPAARKK